jgi:hypothetical protein
MTKTYLDITEELLSDFRGFSMASPQITSLSADLNATDTTLTVDDASGIATGLIEIGDELMWVRSFDESAGVVQLIPSGRGFSGSTASAHSAGDLVTIKPPYPRLRVKRAINDAIQALWPSLYPVGFTEFSLDNVLAIAWAIPEEAEQILDVRYKDTLGNWNRIRAWEVVRSMNTTDFASGVALRITQANIPFGNTVRVVYGKRPTELSADSDLFTVSGYEGQIADLVILAVKARLLPMLDVARLQVTNVAGTMLDQKAQLGSGVSLAQKFQQLYDSRLSLEQGVQVRRFPARIHLTR